MFIQNRNRPVRGPGAAHDPTTEGTIHVNPVTRPARSAAAIGLLAALLTATFGCAPRPTIDPTRLYDRPALARGVAPDPIVVIPGMPASRLVERTTGRVAWDPDPRGASARMAAGEAIPAWVYPMRADGRLEALDDGRLSAEVSGGGPESAGLSDIIAALELGGYTMRPAGGPGRAAPLFRFDYDWRRDIAGSAARLHGFLLDKRRLVTRERASTGEHASPVRFDAVAHASGGLVLRYYLRYGAAGLPDDGSLPPLTWAGAELIDRAILIATPNAGTLPVLIDLARGGHGDSFLPPGDPMVLGTLPAAYQLLPRARHRIAMRRLGGRLEPIDDLLDPTLWETLGWGLASEDRDDLLRLMLPHEPDRIERRRVALDHLRWCLRRARQIGEALDVPARPPSGLTIHLLAGDTVPTAAVAEIDWTTGDPTIVTQQPGDGAVTRGSALLDERQGGAREPPLLSPISWASVMFFHAAGARFTHEPAFVDNLLFLLLEQPH